MQGMGSSLRQAWHGCHEGCRTRCQCSAAWETMPLLRLQQALTELSRRESNASPSQRGKEAGHPRFIRPSPAGHAESHVLFYICVNHTSTLCTRAWLLPVGDVDMLGAMGVESALPMQHSVRRKVGVQLCHPSQSCRIPHIIVDNRGVAYRRKST